MSTKNSLDRITWNWEDWNANDPHGLEALAKGDVNQKALYSMLYSAKYGSQPDLSSHSLNRAGQENVTHLTAIAAATQNWDFDTWNEKDPKGLEALAKGDISQKAMYSALYKAKYGSEPNLSSTHY